jgi:hypothetical protein
MADKNLDGLGLARAFWFGAVRLVLDEHAPGVPRAAARVGSGSEVLGLDDVMSRDHDWGLRLQVFVSSDHRTDVARLLQDHLPDLFEGHPTKIRFTGQEHTALALDVMTVEELVDSRLGFDPRSGGDVLDWLSLTGQAVLEVTAGEVFEDTHGALTDLRHALAWYPHDVWRYVVACDWQRIEQELPLMQRAGDRGDELGSRVIAARLVNAAVHLAFCLCREWMPYSKWTGTRFRDLPVPAQLGENLNGTLHAQHWRSRAQHLAGALTVLADLQTGAGLSTVQPVCVPFWDRPYVHIDPSLVPSVLGSISDPRVQSMPAGIGSIEQLSDNVDLLVHTHRGRLFIGAGQT